jgi:hypothetical protein
MRNTSNGTSAAGAHSESLRQPRLLSRTDAAFYCGVSIQTFSTWVRQGILPSAVPGTARWDLRAINLRLDELSGLNGETDKAPLDDWRAKRARRSEGNS